MHGAWTISPVGVHVIAQDVHNKSLYLNQMSQIDTSEKTLFVRGLDYSTTDARLEEVFSDYGPIKTCFTVKDKGQYNNSNNVNLYVMQGLKINVVDLVMLFTVPGLCDIDEIVFDVIDLTEMMPQGQ